MSVAADSPSDSYLAGLPEDRRRIVLRYQGLLENGGPNSELVHMVKSALNAPNDTAMPEADKNQAFIRMFNLVQTATTAGSDQVQVYADRIWGRLSPVQKRELATNSAMAPAIVMEAMRSDPVLASKIVTPLDQASPRTIDSYSGSAAAGAIGGLYASLRAQDAATAAEAKQYADLGISRSDAGTLSSIGMDRSLFNQYRQMGFSQAQILAAARDAQTLGFHGRDDINIAMHAPSDLRGAAAAIARARTPEEKAAAQRRYDALVQFYQNLPDSDPRKHHANNFIHRMNHGHTERRAQIGDPAARNLSQDQKVAINVAAIGRPAFDQTRRVATATNAHELTTQTNEQTGAATLAALGMDPAPVQQAVVQPANLPGTQPVAGDTKPDNKATQVADAAATPTAGVNPEGDNKAKVARAVAKPPTATV